MTKETLKGRIDAVKRRMDKAGREIFCPRAQWQSELEKVLDEEFAMLAEADSGALTLDKELSIDKLFHQYGIWKSDWYWEFTGDPRKELIPKLTALLTDTLTLDRIIAACDNEGYIHRSEIDALRAPASADSGAKSLPYKQMECKICKTTPHKTTSYATPLCLKCGEYVPDCRCF